MGSEDHREATGQMKKKKEMNCNRGKALHKVKEPNVFSRIAAALYVPPKINEPQRCFVGYMRQL